MLCLQNYRKHYGPFLVLDVPTLELQKGIYWFRGENGAGKTTLLKSIAGLVPFDGEIYINNLSIRNRRREYLKIVNYAEAEPLYPSFLTGKDLVNFYFKTKGGEKEQIEELINHFGMTSYLKNKTSTYSSGMTKKISLLLAFIGHPALILLDEPFITLDVEAVQFLHQYINQRHASGVSFCITSHQPLSSELPFVELNINDKKVNQK